MAQINGEYFHISEPLTVAVFLEERNINRDTVAVELNGEILPKDSFGTVYIKDSDTVEIVNFVCGG
ncbi:MAG: sulfur carrier protein ThiS [Deferribacteraceae bacterium]|jgi:sulfur carrier protein|nr:sulfur carrier protein ThiS [Deferribacteraceae bacterium]